MIVFLNLWVSCLAHSGCLVIGSLTNMSLFWCFPLRLLSHIVKNSLFRFITWHRWGHLIAGHMLSDWVCKAYDVSGWDKADVLSLDFSQFSGVKGSILDSWLVLFLPTSSCWQLGVWMRNGRIMKPGRLCVKWGPLLIKVSDYVLLSKRLRAGPTTFLQHRKKFNVVIIADLESLDSNMEKPTP